MANTWKDTFKAVNVAEEKDELGNPVSRKVDLSVSEPEQEPALTEESAAPAWKKYYTMEEEEEPAADTPRPRVRTETPAVQGDGTTPAWKKYYTMEEEASEPRVSTPGSDLMSPFDKYDKGGLTKDKAVDDKDVMDLMREGLELRFGSRGAIRSAATFLLGGSNGGYTNKMEDEEVYEMWQNWQRSFAGGQTVTVANEVAFNTTLDDEDKATLGAQYLMFDKNPNIFSAEVSWGETFDGMRDYVKAAIWDPLTVVSFGVGKAWTTGGSKAASLSLKKVATNAFKEQIKKGVGKAEAKKVAQGEVRKVSLASIKTGTASLAKISAVDFIGNVGSDVLYQNQLIDTGAQEEYSATQTGIAALSTIMLPAIVSASRGFAVFARSDAAPEGFRAAVDISEEFKGLTKDVINTKVKERINWTDVNKGFKDTLDNFKDNKESFQKWGDAKKDAASGFGDDLDLNPNEKIFVRSFLFGDADGNTKGFVQTMQDAGLVLVQRDKDDNVTNFIGDVIGWLDDDIVSDFVTTFTKEFGDVPAISKIKKSKDLANFWKTRQSEVGARLWDSKQSKVLLTNGLSKDSTAGDFLKAMSNTGNPEVPDKEVGKYVLSLYKSLLTSHPGTTGANIKGWAGTSAANTSSDFIQGALEIGMAPIKGAVGGKEAYDLAVQRGAGSILGAMRRGVSFAMPEDTIEKTLSYMEFRPDVLGQLSKDLGGDSGASAGVETLKTFNLDPNSKLNLGLESTRNFIQSVMGVKLQDEMTKMLSFHSSLETYIRREYGMGYNAFMEDPKLGFVEMSSPRFKKVEQAAVDRTLRETYSKVWTSKPGSNLALSAARFIETVSADKAGGYLIPFGKFFNTSMAMMGDYSGVNAVRVLGGKAIGLRKSSNLESEEGTQLIARAIVGITGVALMSEEKMDNLKEGLRWAQKREDDGSISDKTYDFPESMLHLTGQMLAHWRKDGEVPSDLAQEFIDVTVGQTFRSSSDATSIVASLGQALAEGNMSAAYSQSLEVALGSIGRISSGATRSLEPLNVAIKFAKGNFEEVDRNTSGDAWQDWTFTKKATRYVDEFFDTLGGGPKDSPRAASPTSPGGVKPDVGKVMLGVRGTPGNSLSESMLNSVGVPSWKAFRWGGDADLKNYMNSNVSFIFEEETAKMLERYPDFYELPIARREKYADEVIAISRDRVKTIMRIQGGPMLLLDRLEKVNKDDLKRTQKLFQYEGNPKDMLDQEDGEAKLNQLLDFAEDYTDLTSN